MFSFSTLNNYLTFFMLSLEKLAIHSKVWIKKKTAGYLLNQLMYFTIIGNFWIITISSISCYIVFLLLKLWFYFHCSTIHVYLRFDNYLTSLLKFNNFLFNSIQSPKSVLEFQFQLLCFPKAQLGSFFPHLLGH